MSVTIRPGAMRLADWRTIWRGAAVVLDRAADDAIAASAAAVARILGRHEPVYGINTGFGKLASVRIGDDELEMLQPNTVLSHAAGVGDPMPLPVLRLMPALHTASTTDERRGGDEGVRKCRLRGV